MRSILDQRLDIVETTLETLRVASREESGARRQVADDVALAKTELRQVTKNQKQQQQTTCLCDLCVHKTPMEGYSCAKANTGNR